MVICYESRSSLGGLLIDVSMTDMTLKFATMSIMPNLLGSTRFKQAA